MIKLLTVASFVLIVATSAHAMTPAPVAQPNAITKVAVACGVGRTRIGRVCVARTTRRQVRRLAGVYVGPQAFAVAGDIIEYAPWHRDRMYVTGRCGKAPTRVGPSFIQGKAEASLAEA